MYKILVVDDESIEREGISFLIEKYKFPLEVAQATNGKTALEYMRTHPIDILLTDVKMPQMDGLELARHTFEKYPDVRILVFSAYGEFEFAKKAMAAQAVSYLLKPIEVDEFQRVMTQIIALREEKRRAAARRGISSTAFIPPCDRNRLGESTHYGRMVFWTDALLTSCADRE